MFEVPLERHDVRGGHKKKTTRCGSRCSRSCSDAEGHVVERFQDDYPFEGPLDKLADLKSGNLIFKRPFSAEARASTRWTIVAQDRDSGRTSVEKAAAAGAAGGAPAR